MIKNDFKPMNPQGFQDKVFHQILQTGDTESELKNFIK